MVVTILAFFVLLIVFAWCIYSQAKTKNLLFITILISFAQQYIIPVAFKLVSNDLKSRYFSIEDNDFFIMLCCCIVFLGAMLIGQLCIKLPRDVNIRSCYELSYCENEKRLKTVLLALSILAIILQYKSFNFLFLSGRLSNRLISNQGTGYLQFINVSSYFLVFIGIKQYVNKEISFKYLLLHTVPAFVIYMFKLQRGHAMYPLYFVILTWLFVNIKKKKAYIIVAISAVFMLYIGNVTSSIRRAVVTNEHVATANEISVPASYAHAELLSAVIADDRIEDSPSTIWGSLVNWIPRALYKDKPSSLGPILNGLYSPDNSFYRINGLHRSSYTTDLLIEGYYHLKLLGVFIFGLVFSIIASLVWNQTLLESNRKHFYMTLPLALFIIGYTGFFSDLGNWMGYMVIYYGEFLLITLMA